MQNSKIEWTDHSFNPWHGCVKVSPGCQHCYAEALDRRFGRAVWGPAKTTPRMEMSENYWRQPLQWNTAAAKAGKKARVFCASMADVFEDHPGVVEWRARLWRLIEVTEWLDWLLLTKRPENMHDMLPPAWIRQPRLNVWLGTSTEDQVRFDQRIGPLLSTPALVHFLSVEPMLTRIDTAGYKPAWVICGGESGPKARPMNPDWARDLRDQCKRKNIAFFFKQWGSLLHHTQAHLAPRVWTDDEARVGYKDVGKHAAGRLLDGRTWDELPV